MFCLCLLFCGVVCVLCVLCFWAGFWMTSFLWSLPEVKCSSPWLICHLCLSACMCVYTVYVCFDGTACKHTHQEEESVWCQALQSLASPSQSRKKKKREREEISLSGNGRAPSWISAALDRLHDAGCSTAAQPACQSQIWPLFLEWSWWRLRFCANIQHI